MSARPGGRVASALPSARDAGVAYPPVTRAKVSSGAPPKEVERLIDDNMKLRVQVTQLKEMQVIHQRKCL